MSIVAKRSLVVLAAMMVNLIVVLVLDQPWWVGGLAAVLTLSVMWITEAVVGSRRVGDNRSN